MRYHSSRRLDRKERALIVPQLQRRKAGGEKVVSRRSNSPQSSVNSHDSPEIPEWFVQDWACETCVMPA
jgi:hypothetical protein